METPEEKWIRETGAIVRAAERLEEEIQNTITEFLKRNSSGFTALEVKRITLTALDDCIDTVKRSNGTGG